VQGEPPRHLAGFAALAAAALVTLGSVVVVLSLRSDFGVPLGERLRVGTATLVVAAPLLLAAALALVDPGPDGGAAGGVCRRLVPPGVAAVACTAGVLLAGRLVADLAGSGAGLVPGGDRIGARLGAALVDLGALGLTVALGWWALRARAEGAR
jgi:hypothetical protein